MAVPGESPDEIADRADRLMYMSKRAGRNRVTTDAGPLARGAERSGPSSAPQSPGGPPSVDHQAPRWRRPRPRRTSASPRIRHHPPRRGGLIACLVGNGELAPPGYGAVAWTYCPCEHLGRCWAERDPALSEPVSVSREDPNGLRNSDGDPHHARRNRRVWDRANDVCSPTHGC